MNTKHNDSRLIIAIYYIYTLIVTILTLIMSLFFVVTFWFFLFFPKYKRFKYFDCLIMCPWTFVFDRLLLGIRLKLFGLENIDVKRTTLYICNHQSWLDIPVANKYTHTISLSKKQVRRLPLIGLLIMYAGPIIVDRDDRSSRLGSLKEIINVFKKGYSLTLFPEGTRSRDGKLITPNTAIIKVCYKLNIPVVAAAIEGTRDILPRNRFYLKFLQKVVLRFNSPIYPKDHKNEDEFVTKCWNKVKDTHYGILKEFFQEKLVDY